MKHRRGLTLILVLAVIAGSPVSAQEIVKSVDAEGNVTYSSAPVPRAVSSEAVSVRPGPPPEEAEAARARLGRTQNAVDELARDREKRKTEVERKTAEQAPPSPKAGESRATGPEGFAYPTYPAYGRAPISAPGGGGELPQYKPVVNPPAIPAPLPSVPGQ